MKKRLSRLHFFQRYLYLVASLVALLVCAMLVVRFFVISPGKVNGRSMEPTYLDDEVFFVNKFVYLLHRPKRFDIVQVIEPESKKLIIKRIIGEPGDVVIIKRGYVYLIEKGIGEEKKLDETAYLSRTMFTKVWAQKKPERYELGEHEYFLLGDNRVHSTDSRDYGPVSRTVIVGKVIVARD